MNRLWVTMFSSLTALRQANWERESEMWKIKRRTVPFFFPWFMCHFFVLGLFSFTGRSNIPGGTCCCTYLYSVYAYYGKGWWVNTISAILRNFSRYLFFLPQAVNLSILSRLEISETLPVLCLLTQFLECWSVTHAGRFISATLLACKDLLASRINC